MFYHNVGSRRIAKILLPLPNPNLTAVPLRLIVAFMKLAEVAWDMDVPFPYSNPIQIVDDNDYMNQGPVSKPLQQLDNELEEHDTSLVFEIAEDTYAALLNNLSREDKVTVYTSKSLYDIQKDMPT